MPKMTSVRDVLLVLSVVVSVGKINGPSSANVSGWFFGATNCANSSLRDGSSSSVFHSCAERPLLDATARTNARRPACFDIVYPDSGGASGRLRSTHLSGRPSLALAKSRFCSPQIRGCTFEGLQSWL